MDVQPPMRIHRSVTESSREGRKVAPVMQETSSTGRRVLVVEDEPDLRELLSFNLQSNGYSVETAESGAVAIARLEAFAPDVVLLDLMLPDMSGTEICRRIRSSADGRQPVVIMLTAKGEEIDRVVGFELGANDYVVKPFSMRELVLRVNAFVRRRRLGPEAESGDGKPRGKRRAVVIGLLTVDTDAHRVFVSGQEIHVSALEMRFLSYLVEHRGRVRSRDDLLEDVWGYSPGATTRTVDTHVKRLRDKLGAAGALIETVRGAGYRLSDAEEPRPIEE
ncbi:MAG: two-component system, OmpR family, phosphate regulon response regulator PhoB [Myxococcales bacterium]|jgi:two-component system phosphate regulon response regulator PhoB|nr:two-component system, OmpR family, phosphate regulon response regulator PhoB [Myxococcales bacterium]